MTPKTKSEEAAREMAESIFIEAPTQQQRDMADSLISRITTALRERDETVSDLRAKLAEVDKWMEHKLSCQIFWPGCLTQPCNCGLDKFRKTLK